jgi:ubiquinone/menaquinone biosynthesis C-methylase UbiE
LDAYRKAIPASKRGSEYTGAQWFCEYWLASAAERKAMVTDPYTDDYVQCFTDRKCALLKEYLKRRFGLVRFRHEAQQKADWRHSYLHEFMETLNPWREEWEKADKVMSLMDFKSGQTVADIGSGPGFYTFRFARAVGPHGKVYAVDINDEHLAYVSRTARKFGVHQVESVNSGSGEIGITNRVDTVFLCGVYTAIYSGMPDNNRKEFIETIRTMLKPDGRLVVVDTPLVEGDIPFFYSPYTAKELVAAQLKHYGFRLVADHPIIPERYLMIFRKAELPGKPAVVPQRR